MPERYAHLPSGAGKLLPAPYPVGGTWPEAQSSKISFNLSPQRFTISQSRFPRKGNGCWR